MVRSSGAVDANSAFGRLLANSLACFQLTYLFAHPFILPAAILNAAYTLATRQEQHSTYVSKPLELPNCVISVAKHRVLEQSVF